MLPTAKRPRLEDSGPQLDPYSFQVVFLVDASGSMSMHDVESSTSGRTRRIDAVFDAIGCFGEALLGLDGVACSIAIFNDSHYFAMRSQKVGIHFGQQLREVQAAVSPSGGGLYLRALQALREAVSPSSVTVGILLSDGVPLEDMRDSDCAGTPHRARLFDLMRTIRMEMGPRCVLHTVGFGDFSPDCLQALAQTGGGTFHDNRQLQATALRNTFRRLFGKVSTLRSTVMHFGAEALKPLPPREMEAVDAWERGSPEELREMSRQFEAWIMLPRVKGYAASELVPQEPSRKACLHVKPFAEGALRYAFHFFILGKQDERALHLVVKEGKYKSASNSPLEAARAFLQNHDKATELAAMFRKACLACSAGAIAANFVPAFVIKIVNPSAKQDVRFTTAEGFITGEFVKLNGNDGYVNDSVETIYAQAAGAFSHFSFDATGGKLLCVDVQGVGLRWTDPQLHSLDKSFGPADLGRLGMTMFFSTHVCSSFCAKLKLRAVDAETLAFAGPLPEAVSSPASSSSSSAEDSDSDEQPEAQAISTPAVPTQGPPPAGPSPVGAAQPLRPGGKAKTKKKTKATRIEKKLSAAAYPAALYAFLKKNGMTTLSSLGCSVPRKSFTGAPKLGVALKADPKRFVIIGDTVDIRR